MNLMNLSNIDICTAYKAVGGSDFTEWSTFDTFYNINTLSNIEEESEEKENEVHVQDTFLDESFLVSKNINLLKAESPTLSPDMKHREIYSGGEIFLEHKSNIHNEPEEKNTYCIGNEILKERNLSSYKDEIDVEIYQSSFTDRRRNELKSDKEMEIDNRVRNLDDYDSKIDKCKAFRALVSKIIELESQMEAIELDVELYQSSFKDRNNELGSDKEKEVDSRVSNLDDYDSKIDKCKAFSAIFEPFKLEYEYEYQESNIYYSNIDQCKAFHVEDISKIENQHKTISLDTCFIINSYEKKHENENEENYCEMLNISCSKIDNCKAFKVDDIGIKSTFTASGEYTYLPSMEYISHSNDLDSNTPVIRQDTSLLEDENLEINDPVIIIDRISNINKNEVLESSSISFSVMDLCKAFHAKEVQVATSEPKEVLNEYCSFSIHERQKERLDDDHFALSNLCYSIIDQCKAFYVKPIQEVTLQTKEKLNDYSFPSSREIQLDRLEDCNPIKLSNFCYSKLDLCKVFHAEEIQLVAPQPKEVSNEYICPSLRKGHKKRLEDDHMELSNICYSKLDQCKAFKATTIAIRNTSTTPEKKTKTKTKTKAKTTTKAKKCTQPSIIGSIKHRRDLYSSTAINQHKETTTLGESSSKMSDPVISMSPVTDNNEPVLEITQVGGKSPIVTLSKEESDYVLSVKLENFKNL